MRKSELTLEHKQYIQDNYLTVPAFVMAAGFGLKDHVVTGYMKKNGLRMPAATRYKLQGIKAAGRTTFTSEEDQYLNDHYLTTPVASMAKALNRSDTGVARRLKNLKLIIPPEISKKHRLASLIKPGATPPNKGRKQTEWMSADSIERTINTRFYKGQVSQNAYDRDGIITIRHDHPKRRSGKSYKYIRISLGKWQAYHKYIWEQHHGPVAKGYCLWFKDGDTMNCVIGNLELITRRENRIRNSGTVTLNDKTVARYMATTGRKIDKELQEELLKHPDLINIKRHQLKLNRTLNGKLQD